MRTSAMMAMELAPGVGESWKGLRRTSRPPMGGASEERSKKPPCSRSAYFSRARSMVRRAVARIDRGFVGVEKRKDAEDLIVERAEEGRTADPMREAAVFGPSFLQH